MAINLIEKLQEKLGYEPIHKIDPNTQQEKIEGHETNSLAQAAIPAVLVGLFKYTRSNDNSDELQRGNNFSDWDTALFAENAENVIDQVAAYAGVTAEEARGEMAKIVSETIRIVRENIGEQNDGQRLRDTFTNQRDQILLYLPPSLHLGEHLNDPAMDDRTNKMEGPISSLMHTIEKVFSSSDSERDHNIKQDTTRNDV